MFLSVRSSWLSAGVLSTDPAKTRTNARLFLDHILRLAPLAQTPYDRTSLEDDTLMRELQLFCDSEPTLVWRSRARYGILFKHLALRFMSCPDSVLDVEGTHAVWKWISTQQRGSKFKMLSAILKIKHFINHQGGLPTLEEFKEHMLNVQRGLGAQYRACMQGGVVAPGMRQDDPYNERFNLRPADIDLLRDAIGERPRIERTPEVAWGMYCRFLFRPNTFYSFAALDSGKYLFVAENKSFAGRDEKTEGEAVGRALSIVYFEKIVLGWMALVSSLWNSIEGLWC